MLHISTSNEKEDLNNDSYEFSKDSDDHILISNCMKEHEKLENLDTIRKGIKSTCYKSPLEVLYKFLTRASFWKLINVPIFWCSICIYILIRVCQILEIYPKGDEGIYFATPMSTLGTFMSFSITFYTSNCYQRFESARKNK